MCERGPNVYAITRDFWDDPEFSEAPFTDREAWLWLIGAAAWKDIRTRGNNGAVNLRRGEFSFSIRFLARKWQWKKGAVECFLAKHLKLDSLRDTSRDGTKIYFIKNYNRFQIVGAPKPDNCADTSPDTIRTAEGQQPDKEETGETGNSNYISSLRSDIRPAAQAAAEPAVRSRPDVPAKPPEKTEAPKRSGLSDDETAVVEAYNAVAAENGWPTARHVTAKRRTQIRVRLQEAGGIDGWRAGMELARASPFLRGEGGRSPGHANWTPDFDFFLKQDHFTRLMEGGYGTGNRTGNHPDGSGNGVACESPARSAARRVIAQMYGGNEVQFPV